MWFLKNNILLLQRIWQILGLTILFDNAQNNRITWFVWNTQDILIKILKYSIQ